MFKFITRQHFLINLLAAILLLVLLLFILLWMLGFITRHGESEKVPVVTGKSVEQATKILESKGFEVEVQDSVWNESIPPLTVARQLPEGDQLVKAHRRIYLTINRREPPLVIMPDMVGLSFRNAELYLKQLGMKLGDTTRKPDYAKDAVMEQLYNGHPLKAGTQIFQGSRVSFVLASGVGNEEFDVPDLLGMTFSEAKPLLDSLGLNTGAVLTDPGLSDTAHAFIYKQIPEKILELPDNRKQVNKIRSGQSIDVWLSTEMRYLKDSVEKKD